MNSIVIIAAASAFLFVAGAGYAFDYSCELGWYHKENLTYGAVAATASAIIQYLIR